MYRCGHLASAPAARLASAPGSLQGTTAVETPRATDCIDNVSSRVGEQGLQDILRIQDPESFAIAFCDHSEASRRMGGEPTTFERVTLLVDRCQFQLAIGGLFGALCTLADEADSLVAALAEIGATRPARLLRSLFLALGGLPARAKASARNPYDLLDPSGKDRLRELEAHFDESEVWSSLVTWLDAHRAEIAGGALQGGATAEPG